MDLEKELVFCSIEEDNLQRAYFRVRPLLTAKSSITEEAAALWPDDGCLRIVPDRNEQHTFKERMRTLGGYCVMNLVGISPEANKIRTNKNYNRDKGEVNQYILYSDTVQPVPEHTFFHVLTGAAADYAALAEKAFTPLFYIMDDLTLYGPVRKSAPVMPGTAAAGDGMLFPIADADGKEHMILCCAPAEADAPADKPAEPQPVTPSPEPAPKAPEAPAAPVDESLPIGQPLRILDQSKDFEETLHSLDQPLSKGANLLRTAADPAKAPVLQTPRENKPLSGTPLFRAPMRTSTPQNKNKLQEVVASQWRVVRNDPPAAPLPAGATMRHVENPIQVACERMQDAWQMSESRPQLIDFLLSLDGMQARLEPRLNASAGETALQRVLKARLEDLEAERLTSLVQLDQAKATAEDYRKQVLSGARQKIVAEQMQLDESRKACEDAVSAMKAQLAALAAQRDELTSRIDALSQDHAAALGKALADAQLLAPGNHALRLSCVPGAKLDADALIARMQSALSASGVASDRNAAVALLALLAVSPRIGVACSASAALSTLAANIARHMGWAGSYAHQIAAEQKPVVMPAPVDSTPAVLATSLAAYATIEGATKVFLARSASWLTRNAAYEASSWPILTLNTLPFVAESEAPAAEPVSAASLQALTADVHVTDNEVHAVLDPILRLFDPLSGAAWKELVAFVSAAEPLMEGGLAAACDWAISLWVLPLLEKSPRAAAALKPLLAEYPRSLGCLRG